MITVKAYRSTGQLVHTHAVKDVSRLRHSKGFLDCQLLGSKEMASLWVESDRLADYKNPAFFFLYIGRAGAANAIQILMPNFRIYELNDTALYGTL